MKRRIIKNFVAVAIAAALVFASVGAAFASDGADGRAEPYIAGKSPAPSASQQSTDSAGQAEAKGAAQGQAEAKGAARGGDVGALAYAPSDGSAKYIKEMVDAKLLTTAAYDKPFYDGLTRAELAAYAMALYKYLGGIAPGTPADHYGDTADPNAENGYTLGFFKDSYDEYEYEDGSGGSGGSNKYFCPNDYVRKGESLTVLAKAVAKAKPSEAPLIPTAEAALAALRLIYLDASNISADELPYIGFMNARGALLLPRGETAGSAWLSASYDISREDFFIMLSDAAWAFAKSKISPHATKPLDPLATDYLYQSYFASAYKNNANLTWQESPGAYLYNVNIYVAKKLKAKLTCGGAYLRLDKTSNPTYASVFGNPKSKKTCYLKVQAVDRHGVKSKKALKVNFYAEKFVNTNHKIFGNKNRFGFKNAKAAKKYQKSIKVKVWKLKGKKKVRSSMWLTVNKEIADDVKKIFAEIYKGKEKFPFNAMGGFQIRESKTSEHNHGTAIDINPNENCMKDGKKVVAGKFWRPGKNPYSIKKDGDVVKAFEKYGWYWGGNGWGIRKDYMHFSYFHT